MNVYDFDKTIERKGAVIAGANKRSFTNSDDRNFKCTILKLPEVML